MTRTLLGLALGGLALLAAAQQSLEVISLRYRTADQVIDTLRPLVEPGGTLTGQGNQLIVRVSPANLAEIRQALDAIDRPQRKLQISVRFDDALQASRRDLSASGTISNYGTRIELRGVESQRAGTEQVDQRVLAMDGGRATIFTGPEEATGFAVVPRLLGQQVTVEIFALRGNTTAVSSVVTGRLGEWFELGAVPISSARDDRAIGAVSQASESGTRRVRVKVETLDR